MTAEPGRITSIVAKRRRTIIRQHSAFGGIAMWVVIGIMVVAVLFLLARTLSRTTGEPAPTPILATANQDLISLTRMLGDIEIDTIGLDLVSGDFHAKLEAVDSLIAERNWQDATTNLRKLLKGAPPEDAAWLRAYLGFCFFRAASPDWSLNEYRKALRVSETGSGLYGRSAFNIGYLFQSRGFADSAEAYYSAARTVMQDSTPLKAAVLNNLGLLRETANDTARARELYAAAAGLVDTSGDTRAARTLRDNLRRVTR